MAEPKHFATCCKDLADALTLPTQRGWFDQAILFFAFAERNFKRAKRSNAARRS